MFDGNKNGNEFLFSNTLAYNEEEEVQDEDEDDDITHKKKSKDKIVPLKDLPVVRQTVKEQNDWMAVKEDDI